MDSRNYFSMGKKLREITETVMEKCDPPPPILSYEAHHHIELHLYEATKLHSPKIEHFTLRRNARTYYFPLIFLFIYIKSLHILKPQKRR